MDERVAANDEELERMEQEEAAATDLDARAKQITNELPPRNTLSGFQLQPVDFDKDNGLHMRLVTAVSNLRARNYGIDEADRYQSRRIAGKIIPAIATTTAMVVGLISLELFKLLQRKPLEAYKCAFANLALPLITLGEPAPCAKRVLRLPAGAKFVPRGQDPKNVDFSKEREMEWTLWDKLEVEGPKTLEELLKWGEVRCQGIARRGTKTQELFLFDRFFLVCALPYWQEQFGQEVCMITYGAAMLFAEFMSFTNPQRADRRKKMTCVLQFSTAATTTHSPCQTYPLAGACEICTGCWS